MADTVYLTPAEWQAMATGIDFTTLSDAEQEALIAAASIVAEQESGLPLGGSWLATAYVNEQHRWRATHRAYLYNWPLISVDEVRLRVGAQTAATIQATEIYKNATGHYIEVSSLALAFGIAPDIVSLGIPTEMEVDYTAGYETIPNDLKQAVAIIAAAKYMNKKTMEEGTAGVVSFAIGAYQVSYGTNTGKLGGLGGFSNFVPDEAKLILRSYKSVFLR